MSRSMRNEIHTFLADVRIPYSDIFFLLRDELSRITFPSHLDLSSNHEFSSKTIQTNQRSISIQIFRGFSIHSILSFLLSFSICYVQESLTHWIICSSEDKYSNL